MRVGFLYNHDQVHQVAHSLPVALALAREAPEVEIVVATTSDRLTAEVVRLSEGVVGQSIKLVELGLIHPLRQLVAETFDAVAPAAKLLAYGANLGFFRSLDVLVVTELTSLILRTHYGLNSLQIICIPHGAGDRAVGFDKAIAAFDQVLVAGRKVRDRLVAEAGVDPNRITIVGYPKFDIADASGTTHPVHEDGRRIVLYNPHVSPHLSSWYTVGRKVLDWFLEHDDDHLIFAPHVMLFERRFVLSIDRLGLTRPGRIQERYLHAPNIHIDLGSRASTTMAYTDRADVYIGDASSQVYEFLRRPRPCVFLNPNRLEWRGDPNFAHWTAGPVIEDVGELGEAIRVALDDHAAVYQPIQQALFAHTFDIDTTPASLRAARALLEFARA